MTFLESAPKKSFSQKKKIFQLKMCRSLKKIGLHVPYKKGAAAHGRARAANTYYGIHN
jgi:hypothetical protein